MKIDMASIRGDVSGAYHLSPQLEFLAHQRVHFLRSHGQRKSALLFGLALQLGAVDDFPDLLRELREDGLRRGSRCEHPEPRLHQVARQSRLG